jgi:hypothetical protein
MAKRALKLALWPAAISLAVTAARFFAERANLPDGLTFWIGITWVAVLTGLYYGLKLAGAARPYALLALTMLFLGWLSRIPAVALWWITKAYGLGTHYDVFENWGSALALQLLLGPLEHLAFGIPGMAVLAWKRRKRPAHA